MSISPPPVALKLIAWFVHPIRVTPTPRVLLPAPELAEELSPISWMALPLLADEVSVAPFR